VKAIGNESLKLRAKGNNEMEDIKNLLGEDFGLISIFISLIILDNIIEEREVALFGPKFTSNQNPSIQKQELVEDLYGKRGKCLHNN
jgi:hypothetical protein